MLVAKREMRKRGVAGIFDPGGTQLEATRRWRDADAAIESSAVSNVGRPSRGERACRGRASLWWKEELPASAVDERNRVVECRASDVEITKGEVQ